VCDLVQCMGGCRGGTLWDNTRLSERERLCVPLYSVWVGAGVVLSGTIQGSLKERVQINPGSCSVGVKRKKTMKWSRTGWFYLNLSSIKKGLRCFATLCPNEHDFSG
jgi:hypothetical protein